MMDIKKKDIKEFLESEQSALNTVRTLLLFGRNSATYKFALCNALMKAKPSSELVASDLTEDFINEFISHYKNNPHQFNNGSTSLTKSIDQYLSSSKSHSDWSDLIDKAEKVIYLNVIDRFQNVGGGEIEKNYMLYEPLGTNNDKASRKLILTDNILQILENDVLKKKVLDESHSRWQVVEEAWRAGVNPNTLEYDKQNEIFYSNCRNQRIGLRSAVDVLSPYQKGKCFYCGRQLDKEGGSQSPSFPDVDHVFPLEMLVKLNIINPNGIWNLVIACMKCNRGADGKFMTPPCIEYFEKLLKRNVLFVEEHNHSLRNSILLSLNARNKAAVTERMKAIFKHFDFIKGWKPVERF